MSDMSLNSENFRNFIEFDFRNSDSKPLSCREVLEALGMEPSSDPAILIDLLQVIAYMHNLFEECELQYLFRICPKTDGGAKYEGRRVNRGLELEIQKGLDHELDKIGSQSDAASLLWACPSTPIHKHPR